MTTYLTPQNPPVFTDTLPALETTSLAHPDTWNPLYQTLLTNDAYLRDYLQSEIGETGMSIVDLANRVGDLEETSSVSVQRAVTLDWLYRDNKIAFELWAPGFTLIDAIDTAIVSGISGDDSVDVADTSQLRAGEYYVLADDAGEDILIKCTAILTSNRIRIETNLSRNLGVGVLTRCSMSIVGAVYADCALGNIWLSKPINIGDDAEGGAVVIRRSLNSGEARLYFRDAEHAAWTERVWSVRRQGGDIPAGFADYEYILPMRGDGNLMVNTAGEPMQIRHIIALSAPTGLGGFMNPAMRPATPVISAPANAATGIPESPTLAIASYTSPGGTPQAGIEFQVATADTFATIVHDSGVLPAALSYQMPAGVLVANTAYYVRARVQDSSMLWSDWSAVTSFTTAVSFAYISAPTIVTPANGAIDVGETPTLQTGAFAVIGGTDTHAASQWQVRAAAGDWAAPLYDSGEDAVNLLSLSLPAGYLQPGQKEYYIRARHKGTSLGWSEFSGENKITTKAVFANVAGVALITPGGDGGTWVYIDQDGNAVPSPDATFFNTHPVWGGIQDVLIDGQQMVKIPKFYIKRGIIGAGANAGKEAWWLSDQPSAGYVIHPAFKAAGLDIDQFYYGKYQASIDGAAKMASVPGVMPAVSRSLTQFIADAEARNVGGVTGFMLHSVYQWAAIQWLYLIENATMNSQAKTGQGRVAEASAANVDAADVATATYRGMVGLWGNVWQWMDGLKTETGTGYFSVWDRVGNKTWVSTGVKRSAADGTIYPVTFMGAAGAGFDFDDFFIGDTGPTTNSDATAPDYQYFATGEYFPIVGGSWGNGADAGLWHVNCSRAASSTGTYVGARLAKV